MELFKKNKQQKGKQQQDAQATQSALNEAEQDLQGDPLQEAVKKKQRKQQ